MPLQMFTKKLGDQKKKSFVIIESILMPGNISLLPSGHDSWVVGNEPAVVLIFRG
jgi:hypothetical protein